MPNWCYNKLKASGTPTDIAAFTECGFVNGEWRLSHYLPLPKELEQDTSRLSEKAREELKEKYGCSDAYNWHIMNYGCKWDCYAKSADCHITPTEVSIVFDSPWSPPVDFLVFLQNKYPKLHFKMSYMEVDNWYAGVAETFADAESGKTGVTDHDADPEYRDENWNLTDPYSDEFDRDNTRYYIVNPLDRSFYITMEPSKGKPFSTMYIEHLY